MKIIFNDSGQDLYHIFDKLMCYIVVECLHYIVLTHLNMTYLVLFVPNGAYGYYSRSLCFGLFFLLPHSTSSQYFQVLSILFFSNCAVVSLVFSDLVGSSLVPLW